MKYNENLSATILKKVAFIEKGHLHFSRMALYQIKELNEKYLYQQVLSGIHETTHIR